MTKYVLCDGIDDGKGRITPRREAMVGPLQSFTGYVGQKACGGHPVGDYLYDTEEQALVAARARSRNEAGIGQRSVCVLAVTISYDVKHTSTVVSSVSTETRQGSGKVEVTT